MVECYKNEKHPEISILVSSASVVIHATDATQNHKRRSSTVNRRPVCLCCDTDLWPFNFKI